MMGKEDKEENTTGRQFIVTETVFSMDGDVHLLLIFTSWKGTLRGLYYC